LLTPQDVEAWIEEHNACMQEMIGPKETGVGVCFHLAAGGKAYLQTLEVAVVLDLDEEAAWIAPLVLAAGDVEPPRGRTWVLPADRLVQLILGLSTLVESSTLVSGHRFGARPRAAGRG
jgi:hypothetical protein